jgi:hypothetical protein
LDNNSSAWASVTVPSPFLGSAALKFSGDPSIDLVRPLVRGAGLASSSSPFTAVSTTTPDAEFWLVYENASPPELRLARTFYISITGNNDSPGTYSSPFRTPKNALDLVPEDGAAELVFLNVVEQDTPSSNMPAYRDDGTSIDVFMNIDYGKKIILSTLGLDMVPRGVRTGLPALWINGGAHVTLQSQMTISGGSSNDISLVTIYNGTLAFKDSAHVVTERNTLKSIGVRHALPSSEAAFIELNDDITPSGQMDVRLVGASGEGVDEELYDGQQVLIGSAVSSEHVHFQRSHSSAQFTANGLMPSSE